MNEKNFALKLLIISVVLTIIIMLIIEFNNRQIYITKVEIPTKQASTISILDYQEEIDLGQKHLYHLKM